jgi:Ner family transcriptional regulator
MAKPPSGWDRPAIIAELHRRGMTLTGVAIDAGLYPSACRQGISGNSVRGAQAIADALGEPLEELFPAFYLRGRHHRQQANRNGSRNTSANRTPIADKARRAG